MKVNINAGLPSLRSRATSCKYTRLTWVRDSVVNYCFPSLSLSLSFILQESSTPFWIVLLVEVNFLERKEYVVLLFLSFSFILEELKYLFLE